MTADPRPAVPGNDYILILRCPDRPGILAAVTTCLYRQGCDIRDAAQYGDPVSGTFFVRIHFAVDGGLDDADFRKVFTPVAETYGVQWSFTDMARRPRTLIAVSKQGHCLNDLLHRWQSGLLHTDIAGVVSNHEDMRSLVEWHNLPYHYLPVTPGTKPQQEQQLLALIEQERVDLLVLGRYMQILSAGLCKHLAGRCINIHHSFLPSFKGARPYHQAHERGVKLIGATAHYVTSDLDEGPIIEQDVIRITHAVPPEELVNLGREVEARVLARAVRWHVEHRVMLNGHRTIVFP